MPRSSFGWRSSPGLTEHLAPTVIPARQDCPMETFKRTPLQPLQPSAAFRDPIVSSVHIVWKEEEQWNRSGRTYDVSLNSNH